MSDFVARLHERAACSEAITWAESLGPGVSLEHAWAICERGDWLLWWAGKNGGDCSELGYWCAERARQSAIRALGDLGAGLIACGTISDRRTARAAASEAAAAGVAAAAAAAAAAEAGVAAAWAAAAWVAAAAAAAAAAWAAAAASEAAEAAWVAAAAAEMKVIADEVRRRINLPGGER